jgi:uncharacterized protein YgbK (DUF1537 family)
LADQIKKSISRGNEIITFDAITETNLDAIIEASKDLSKQIMIVGSSGLANAVAKKLGNRKPVRLSRRVSENCILTICGSRSRVSFSQIQILKSGKNMVTVALDPRAIFKGSGDQEISRLEEMLSTGIDLGKDVILTIEDTTVEKGREKAIIAIFGEVVARILSHFRPRIGGMILVGGDTSLCVLNRLKCASIRIVAEPIPGLPLMRFHQGWLEDLLLITKAGGFGAEQDLLRAYKFLKGKRCDLS